MRRLRILTYVVLAYLVLAIIWWAILLLRKNTEAFEGKSMAAKIAYDLRAQDPPYSNSDIYNTLKHDYDRQRTMIYGEAAVFIVALFVGLWLINRGYTRELEATNQKRNFLLAITHEFKSPLTSIKLVLQSLAGRKFTPKQQGQLIEDGTLEVERLNNLVDNILLAARLEKSYHPIFEKSNLQEILDKIVSNIKKKHPDISLVVDNKIDNSITIDRDGLTSVLYNLVDNAAKYGNQGDEIQISSYMKKSQLHISVADQGFGISASEKSKVFNQFYRAGNEDTRKTQGTGLGLYLVRKLVGIYNGTVEVQDNKPRGTLFKVKLPLQ